MQNGSQETLKEFASLMAKVRAVVPEQYGAFMAEKEKLTQAGALPEKTKWLLMLAASVAQKCPVCIPRAVQHCIEHGWSEREMLEAGMVAVLIGGSSAMTAVTMVMKAIEELKKQ